VKELLLSKYWLFLSWMVAPPIGQVSTVNKIQVITCQQNYLFQEFVQTKLQEQGREKCENQSSCHIRRVKNKVKAKERKRKK
jgi:hypothetical protein